MTFNSLLIGVLVAFISITIGETAAKHFGGLPGVGAGLLTATICVTIIGFFCRARWRKDAQQRREYKEKYTHIYRVLALPTDGAAVKKAQGAEIKVGDFGWEAAPLRNDGLIYVQGLNAQWRVVWYAGFRPEEIENVARKPQSQYDWDSTWIGNPPPCPFPVQEHLHPTINMGFPMPVKTKRVSTMAK